VILLLNIILLNVALIFDPGGQSFDSILQKADSCLEAENYSCAIQYYSKIEKDSLQFDSTKELLEFQLNFSNALFITGDYPNSLIAYEKLKNLAIQAQNRFYEGKARSGISHSLWRMTENVRAIEEILKAIEIFKELDDTPNLIEAANILGGIYVSIKKFKDGRAIYKEMLDKAIQSRDTFNIATNYEYLGIVDYFEGNFQSAIDNYEKSLEINEVEGNSFRISINLVNIAEPKMELEEYQEALNLLHQGINLQEKHNYKSVLIYSYYTIGKVHTRTQSFDSGLYYYEKSLQMMHETSETRDKQEVYKLIAENYAQQGMFQQAYEYHRLHSIEKDSLIALERTKELEEIKTRYEVEGKIKENEALILQNTQKERELLAQKDLIQLQYTIGVLIIIFLVISLFLAFRLYHVRQTLINANKSKDKLFGIIAHDLKGPIGNIEAMLKLMQVERDEKRIAQYFEYLSKSIQNLSTLTSQLLSWTFSHKGDFNFKIENINVREISDRSLELFEYQLTEKRIITINSIENDLYVRADENALLTIFRNIISNAIKFTNKKGQLILEAKKQNNFIEIKFRDNGLGMTESAIQKVLKGRHMVSSAGTDNEKGSGLGFSIVIEFVKKMKGKIDIQSDGKSGTTVILKLRKA